MKQQSVLGALREAAKGLLFPSESEAPLEPFLWESAGDKLTLQGLREQAGADARASVEVISLDGLLATVPSEDRPKFRKLAAAVQEQLAGVKVYKVGG